MITDYEKNVNRSLAKKRIDYFQIRFIGIDPDNILGRQCKSIERPTITFATTEANTQARRVPYTSRPLSIDDFSVVFFDDNFNLTNKVLYEQVINQAQGKLNRFDILVECYGADQSLVESYTIKGCLIVSIRHLEHVYANSQPNEITVTCSAMDVDIHD